MIVKCECGRERVVMGVKRCRTCGAKLTEAMGKPATPIKVTKAKKQENKK